MKEKSNLFRLALIEGFLFIFLELTNAAIIEEYFGSNSEVFSIIISGAIISSGIGYFIGGFLKIEKLNFFNLAVLQSILILCPIFVKANMKSIFIFENFNSNLYFLTFILFFTTIPFITILNPLIVGKLSIESEKDQEIPGKIFSISTLGGIIGVILCGVFIFPSLGILAPVFLLSIVYFLFLLLSQKSYQLKIKNPLKVLYVVILFFAFINYSSFRKVKNVNTLKYESYSTVGNIKVVDFFQPEANLTFRKMLFNNIAQTQIRTNQDAQSSWVYPHVISMLSSGVSIPKPKTLLIGLGGGSIAKELYRQGIKATAIENDSRVPKIAEEFFYLKKNEYNLLVDDGRNYLNHTDEIYDLIIVDVLQGEIQPSYIFSIEALQLFKKCLSPNGVMLVNFQGTDDQNEFGLSFYGLYKTFLSAKFEVSYWKDHKKTKTNDIVFVLQKKQNQLKYDRKKLQSCCLIYEEVKLSFNEKLKKIDLKNHFLSNSPIITDDNPCLEWLNKKNMFEWRKKMILN